jgi:hypothetical protein
MFSFLIYDTVCLGVLICISSGPAKVEQDIASRDTQKALFGRVCG